MQFDIFFSICQTEVDGYLPTEKVMWQNFFEQVRAADDLGYNTAWVAETHLSCQIQKQNAGAVIPHFKGEIGLNTDILQLAHFIFDRTKKIHVGSAIRNIQCNGGPIAHAEAVKTFLSFHQAREENWFGQSTASKGPRKLHLGFASGRFPFSNRPYGIKPRNHFEEATWPPLRGKIFQEAVEIFLRFLRGDIFSSQDVRSTELGEKDFRSPEEWQKAQLAFKAAFPDLWQKISVQSAIKLPVDSRWSFEKLGVIPFATPLEYLQLYIGAHDAPTQHWANEFMPVGVFNLSITPDQVIEQTHQRMSQHFHQQGGQWSRKHMPRTVLVFLDSDSQKAEKHAKQALGTYWQAMEGTLDPEKVKSATKNALVGSPQQIVDELKSRFHQEDRLMLWFDFNNHNSSEVVAAMEQFKTQVVEKLQ